MKLLAGIGDKIMDNYDKLKETFFENVPPVDVESLRAVVNILENINIALAAKYCDNLSYLFHCRWHAKIIVLRGGE
jgi:hypothetical protein